MMKNYPSLYPDRKRALLRLFTYSAVKWKDGELVFFNGGYDVASRSKNEWRNVIDDNEDIHLRLMHIHDNYVMQFTVDNAELLANYTGSVDRNNKLKPDSCYLPGGYNRFDDMPDIVKEDWFEAAKELAMFVYLETLDSPSPYAQSGHKVVVKFLLKNGLLTRKDHLARIAKLKDELKTLEEALP